MPIGLAIFNIAVLLLSLAAVLLMGWHLNNDGRDRNGRADH